MLALISLVFGGVLRLAPDLIHLFTAKADHAHELDMLKLQQAGAQIEAQMRAAEAAAEAKFTQQNTELADMVEAIKAQGTMSGVKWVDAVSATVRPFVTYWWMILLTLFKITTVVLAFYDNGGHLLLAMHDSWTPEDQNTLNGILGFWFVDRVRRYQTGK